jgi:hypothetical protein
MTTKTLPARSTQSVANASYTDFSGQFIGGKWRPGRAAGSLADRDPYTGKIIADIAMGNIADLDRKTGETIRIAEQDLALTRTTNASGAVITIPVG